MTCLALVARGEPLEVPAEKPQDDGGRDDDRHVQGGDGSPDVRTELLSIYESYAAMYPNPRLAEERRERDQLLQAAAAASRASDGADPGAARGNKKQKRKGGLFGIFGWRDGSGGDDDRGNISSRSPSSNDDGTKLVYEDIFDDGDDAEQQDTGLCGTEHSLDASCIPDEARSFARFHLASTSTRRERPNIARTSWEVAGSSVLVVSGLGEIAEFLPQSGKGTRQRTSDYHDLRGHYSTNPNDEFHTIAYSRAASIGPNLLVISWGLADGVVMFYRRRATTPDDKNKVGVVVTWEAVAMVSPTDAVKSNLEDIFIEEAESGSALLRVTDIVPLVVETDATPAATVAISRLGGYVELVPLPPGMWYGPEIQPPEKKRKRRRREEHYASGLPDLRSHGGGGITALTTSHYHTDIISVEAFRTSVSNDTQWDEHAYPDAPPAEHVLAATGTRDGREVVSFWSVSTIFSDDGESPNGQVGFTLHAAITEAIDLGKVGPDTTIFVNNKIMKLWRKPRRVRLREDVHKNDDLPKKESEPESNRLTTISVPAPVTMMRFVNAHAGETTYLSLLDWNGGLILMDCGLLERVICQSLSDEEYELLYRNEDADAAVPLAQIFSDRSLVSHRIGGSMPSSVHITDIRWLTEKLNPWPAQSRPLLSFTLKQPNQLRILAFPEVDYDSDDGPVAVSLKNGVVALATTRAGEIALVSSRRLHLSDNVGLSLSVLEKPDPRTIIETLVHESKFREAIEAADQLMGAEKGGIHGIVEGLKVQLWKTTFDLQILESVEDPSFIVQTALSLTYRSIPDDLEMDGLSLFREVHRLALQKTQKVELGTQRPESAESPVGELRRRLILLGTYELLCQYFCAEPSFAKFCDEFISTSLFSLAKILAGKAELGALSIICFRHRHETMSKVEILDHIPLKVPPILYHHLLPVPNDEEITHFLTADPDFPLLEWSEMPRYLKDNAGIAVAVDQEDEALVLEEKGNYNFDEDMILMGLDRNASLEGWYASRLEDIQNFSSSLEHTIELCRFGLASMGDNVIEASSASFSPAGSRLERMLARAEALEKLLLDDIEADLVPSSLVSLNLDDLEVMNAGDLVALVFEGLKDPTKVHSRVTSALVPLLANDLVDVEDKVIDFAICSYCTGLLEKCVVGTHKVDVACVVDAVRTCAIFFKVSRSSEDIMNRVIKDKELLAELTKSIFQRVLDAGAIGSFTTEDVRSVIEALWEIYESLPMRLPPGAGENDDDQARILQAGADDMFERLVVLDVLSQWPSSNCFTAVACTDNGDVAAQALKNLCHSFCSQTDDPAQAFDARAASKVLASLVSDVKELRRLNLFQSVDLGTIFVENLIMPLLNQKQVYLVDEFLSAAPREWVAGENVRNAIVSFVDETVFDDNDVSGEALHAAVTCQELLKRHFPSAQDAFLESRRYLDAAHFIANTLLPGVSSVNMRPEALRKQCPIDIIESLLCDYPMSIILDCEDWADPSWAQEANIHARDLRGRKQALTESKPRPEPVIPGRAIFHLAQLLGLESAFAVVAVKCRVIHHGVAAGLHGASAAICRTLLPINCNHNVDEETRAAIVGAVAKVVTNNDYQDFVTKHELCRVLEEWFAWPLKFRFLRAFDAVHDVAQQKLFEQLLLPRDGYNGLRVVERLFVDTKNEYSANLADLFSTLKKQAEGCRIDDSLLNTLSRFLFYWCIAQSTRPKPYQPSSIEQANVQSIMELASSVLLHSAESEVSAATLHELEGILNDQRHDAHIQSSLISVSVKPDREIVHRLVGRGYSDNAARRAAIATSNAGFDEALYWAIAHTLDSNLDDPLVFLRQENPAFVDESDARQLKACLALANRIATGNVRIPSVRPCMTPVKPILKQPSNASASMPATTIPPEKQSEPQQDEIEITANDTSSRCGSVNGTTPNDEVNSTDEEKTSSPPSSPGRPSKPSGDSLESIEFEVPRAGLGDSEAPITFVPPKEPEKTPAELTYTPEGTKRMASLEPSDEVKEGRPSVTIEARPEIFDSSLPVEDDLTNPTSTKSNSGVPTATIEVHVTPPRSVRSNRSSPPSGTPSPRSRSSLLRRGQAALEAARKTGSPAALEERKRLIEAGRRLLRRARLSQEDLTEALQEETKTAAKSPISVPTPVSLKPSVASGAAAKGNDRGFSADGDQKDDNEWDFDF